MEKIGEIVFRPYFLVSKFDEGIMMEFFDTLKDLYQRVLNDKSIVSYSVFRTLEIQGRF